MSPSPWLVTRLREGREGMGRRVEGKVQGRVPPASRGQQAQVRRRRPCGTTLITSHRSDEATFVEGIFVESDDRTIQSLDVYVNAAGEKDLQSGKVVAHQILLHIRGPRQEEAATRSGRAAVVRLLEGLGNLRDGVEKHGRHQTGRPRLPGPSADRPRAVGVGFRQHPDLRGRSTPITEPGAKKGEGMMFSKKGRVAALVLPGPRLADGAHANSRSPTSTTSTPTS